MIYRSDMKLTNPSQTFPTLHRRNDLEIVFLILASLFVFACFLSHTCCSLRRLINIRIFQIIYRNVNLPDSSLDSLTSLVMFRADFIACMIWKGTELDCRGVLGGLYFLQVSCQCYNFLPHGSLLDDQFLRLVYLACHVP